MVFRRNTFIPNASDALRGELDRRRRADVRRSLDNPHPESSDFAELGFEEWTRGLPEQEAEALVDASAVPGKGWRLLYD